MVASSPAASPPPGLKIRILGPIEVATRAGPVHIPRGRPLALVALLAIHRGAIVPADRAIDALWPAALPQHPSATLHTVVARVRRALGPAVLVTAAGGYGLELPPGALDAAAFEQLAARGRDELASGDTARAAYTLRDALALWRGTALTGAHEEDFAAPEVARLDELKVACQSDWIEAELAAGHHEALVGELDALVAEHPMRERLRGQLMLALYRSGRQADALAAYRDTHATFLAELGLEPSPELRRLERAILRHETPPVASPDRRASARGRRRPVTCLEVIALDGASAEGRLDPEALAGLLTQVARDLEICCSRHGGTTHAGGGSLTAIFGAPVAHEDDASRALRAATDLVSMRAVKLGIATGELVRPAGVERDSFVGDALPRASRLASAAAAGEILVDPATWELIRSSALGIARSLPGERAIQASASNGDTHVQAISDLRPLAGRTRELALVCEAFERAVEDRSSHLLTVLGEAGMGKSRLAREAATVLTGRATVLTGRCKAYGEGVTLLPLREIVLAAADGDLTGLMRELGEPDAVATRISFAVGLADGAPVGAPGAAFRRLFAALARRRPIVLVIDDAHWAEPGLLDLLEELTDELAGAPVLLVVLARPELLTARPTWGAGKHNADSLTLGPLSQPESRTLVDALATTLAEADAQRVVATAGGSPLFLEQLATHAAEIGGTHWGIPPAIRSLLASRLDLLDADERELLEAGSVEGERFHGGAVCALCDGVSERAVEHLVGRLVRRGLLQPVPGELPGQAAYAFRHALIRDAAYESIAKVARIDLHTRLAGWLEGIEPGLHEADARVGLHLEAAALLARAVHAAPQESDALAARAGARLTAAARHAHVIGDIRAEIGLLERAVAVLGEDTPRGAELLPTLVAALFEAGGFDRAGDVADRACALGEQLGLERLASRALIERERVRSNRLPERVDVPGSATLVEDAAERLQALGDELGLARAHYLLCEFAWMRGLPEEGYAHAARLLEHARRAEAGFEIAAGACFMAWALAEGPAPVSVAIARCRDLEAELAGDRVAALGLSGTRGVLAAMAGHADVARRELNAARLGLGELGLNELSAYMALQETLAETLLGCPERAERAALAAEQIALETGDRWFQSTVLVDLTHTVLEQGRVEDAAVLAARIESIPAPHDCEWVIKRLSARGRLASLLGHDQRGLRLTQRAAALADGCQFLVFAAEAHRAVTAVHLRAGRRAEAESSAAAAIARYETKENVAGVALMRELLARPAS